MPRFVKTYRVTGQAADYGDPVVLEGSGSSGVITAVAVRFGESSGEPDTAIGVRVFAGPALPSRRSDDSAQPDGAQVLPTGLVSADVTQGALFLSRESTDAALTATAAKLSAEAGQWAGSAPYQADRGEALYVAVSGSTEPVFVTVYGDRDE